MPHKPKAITAQISWLMPLSPTESPNFLAITLQCLEKQTLKAKELVIAADGTLPYQLMRVIKNSPLPINLYLQDKSQGIGATLREIAGNCQGEFIIRIDSDDLYAPNHTEVIANALLKYRHCGVIGSQLIEIDIDRNWKTTTRQTPTSPFTAKKWLPWRNPLNHQTVAIRRKALIRAGGYRHAPGFEDWDLWLRIASNGYELMSLPIYTAAARVNNQHRQRRRGIHYFFKECRFYIQQIKEGKIHIPIGLIACMARLPWRLLPNTLFNWWMTSKLRGSPAIKTAWLSEFLTNKTGQGT